MWKPAAIFASENVFGSGLPDAGPAPPALSLHVTLMRCQPGSSAIWPVPTLSQLALYATRVPSTMMSPRSSYAIANV